MYQIEHFGHVFAIAFGLSAIFYYIELREVAEERIKETLEVLAGSLGFAEQAVKDKIRQLLYASFSEGMLSLKPRSKELKEKLEKLRLEQKHVTWRYHLLDLASIMIVFSHFATHAFAILSTAVSLGALIHAGFDPEYKFGLWSIITMLILSFASIIWSLSFYVVVLPILKLRFF
jgi:hypothetical protein